MKVCSCEKEDEVKCGRGQGELRKVQVKVRNFLFLRRSHHWR